jgi:ABC-type uncharacterized transport system involved in gliding motility auxiliary subunit
MRSRSGALLAFAAIVLALSISERFHVRIDLSADRVNTPGPSLRALAVGIPEKLRISYFVSPLLAQRNPGPGLIEEYLSMLAGSSRNRISLEIVDPELRKEEARQAGIGSGTINIVEKNQNRQSAVQSGILFEYQNRKRVIPFILETGHLESLIARTLRSLVEDREPELAILIGDAGKSLDGDFSILRKILEDNLWKIRELAPGERVPESSSLLLVLGNAALTGASVAPLRDWLESGRNAFFAVKGVDIRAGEDVSAVRLGNSPLLDLLSSCGVAVGRSLVLDRSALTVPFQSSDAPEGGKIDYFLYPHWIMVRPENFQRSGGLIPESGGLDLFWPSPLSASGSPGAEFRPLIMTGKNAWLQTKDFVVRPGPEPGYEAESESTRGRYTLAASARIPMPGIANPANILVVGSSDFASDLSAMTGSSFNADFVLAAVELLAAPSRSGVESAAGAESGQRAARERRFAKAEDPQSSERLVRVNYIVNLALIPASVLALGLVHISRRRKTSGKVGVP